MKTDRRKFISAALGSGALSAIESLGHAATPTENASHLALASDPLRPQYHLLPAANWMNDPDVAVYWNDHYHLMYQYNPDGATSANKHWGHATSPDMVHWRHLPVALAPTPGGPDADGCYTGTAAVKDGTVVALYTGVRAAPENEATIKGQTPMLRETQCLAVAADSDLRTWTKQGTPVISSPPPELQVNGFRDPSPWQQGEWWYTVIASGIANEGGAVLLYRSRDLRAWEFLRIFSRRDRNDLAAFDPFNPWEVWECPEFFPLGDRHVLIFSTAGKTYWQSGRLDKEKMSFIAEQAGILDYGSYYAAKTQLDKEGNRIVWGWIQETRPPDEYKAAGWAGMMSLPRVLTLTAEGRLRFRVADAVDSLRGHQQALTLNGNEQTIRRQISDLRIAGCCGETLLKARRTGGPFEVALYEGEKDAVPCLTLAFDSKHPSQISADARPLRLALDDNEEIELHLYVDGSVIEVLVNGQVALTKRFYYSGRSPRDLRLQWKGSTESIAGLTVWQLQPISQDRLTS